MVLIHISLMTNGTENVSVCPFATHIFSLVKYLIRSFTHLKNQVVCLFTIELYFLICSRYRSFIGYIFANIFFHFVVCLFVFLIVYFKDQTFSI